MEVDIVRKKVAAGDFDIQDFELYLKAIKELSAEDTKIKEVLEGLSNFSIQFSILGVTDVYLKIENGEIFVETGLIDNPNIAFEMTDIVGSGIIKNEIDPISAYLSGDFKIIGDAAIAMKLKPYIQKYQKNLGFKIEK
ncbi:MAG: hypothetical protein EU548_10015 [Promethearchaeota archaeon]|nr:MAG: hypothetical protein EU548_10015 [Candidatus Lokiarchaeota archaeon]